MVQVFERNMLERGSLFFEVQAKGDAMVHETAGIRGNSDA
jgi:hypothetical protein